ncbi:MAG: hypothetical protein U0V70_14430 [Terriglobia bacterium]
MAPAPSFALDTTAPDSYLTPPVDHQGSWEVSSGKEIHVKNLPWFSKRYFERDFPRLKKLVTQQEKQMAILLTVDEGYRVEIRDYQLCPFGLQIESPAGPLLIPFRNIQSIQLVPREKPEAKSPLRH